MDILSPPKACDPWAVYAAKCSLQGNDKFSALTPGQRRIVDYIRAKGEVTVEEVDGAPGPDCGGIQKRIRRAAAHGGPEGIEERSHSYVHAF